MFGTNVRHADRWGTPLNQLRKIGLLSRSEISKNKKPLWRKQKGEADYAQIRDSSRESNDDDNSGFDEDQRR